MRSGTSFLRGLLTAHPGIAASRDAEPQFFSLHWADGPAAYARQWRRMGLPLWPLGNTRLRLDVSPYYLFHPLAPARAASVLPREIPIIAVLRDPAERAWSHYRHSLARGAEHLGGLAALDAEAGRLAADAARIAAGEDREAGAHQRFSYAARGDYAAQLGNWWRFFPQDRCLLIRSDTLFRDPAAAMARVWDHLGLAPVALPDAVGRNAVLPAAMPDAVGLRLIEHFAEPNRRLKALTGIDFSRRG